MRKIIDTQNHFLLGGRVNGCKRQMASFVFNWLLYKHHKNITRSEGTLAWILAVAMLIAFSNTVQDKQHLVGTVLNRFSLVCKI